MMGDDNGIRSQSTVVVIGAGYAGIAAALSLRDCGINVQVVEASNRIGGRACSERRPSVVLDHGGQWVGRTQTRLLSWADRFGCETFPTWDVGEHWEVWHDGTLRRFRGYGPEDGPGMAQYEEAIRALDLMARTVPRDNPEDAKNIELWDGQTAESFFLEHVPNSDARRRLALMVQGVWSCEPRDVSLFHLLFYIASAGGTSQLMATQSGAQEFRFVGGAQAPLFAAAEELGASTVHMNTRVRSVDETRDGVVVNTSKGKITAQMVVVATSPGATQKLSFNPGLPVAKQRWIERSVMGNVAKVHAVYSQPFWRDMGLSGQAVLFGDDPVGVVFDNSPPDAAVGVLVAFVYGDRFRRWSASGDAQRKASVLSTFEKLFGQAAGNSVHYVEKNWPADPFAFGGYAAVPSPGTWFEYAALGWRRPIGAIYWAGSDTASTWNGYFEGAILSGERAAKEVAVALR